MKNKLDSSATAEIKKVVASVSKVVVQKKAEESDELQKTRIKEKADEFLEKAVKKNGNDGPTDMRPRSDI